MKRVLTAFLFVGLIGSARAASASNIVLNPGFETGDFTDWTQFGNIGYTYVETLHNGPLSGTYSAEFGPVGSTGGISQDLPTSNGSSYDLSFSLANQGSPNEVDIFWNGGQIFGPVSLPNQAYVQYVFPGLLATGSSTNLSLAFRNDPYWVGLDDVSVVSVDSQAAPVAPVPEPVSLLLFGTGLAGAGVRRWRKARG